MSAEPVTEDLSIEVNRDRTTELVSPGALRGEIGLTLQTHQALILVQGRAPIADKPAIIGLLGFADRLRVIWGASRNDDPYADWWLIKIDAAIRSATDVIDSQQLAIAEQLSDLTAMDVAVASSEKPTRIRLRFANPYAYQAARLLARFDELICTALTASHVGLLGLNRRQQIQHSGARKLRSLFMLPQAYRLMGLDRTTVRARSGRTNEARQKMGELPADILNGERRAAFAPRQSQPPRASKPANEDSVALSVSANAAK